MKRAFLAFVLVCLPTALVQAQDSGSSKVETGAINGAPFRLEIPANWNKGLVMYCHGYQLAGSQPNLDNPRQKALRDVFLSRGFAFAESAYSIQGWAVKEAVEDTEALRRYFVSKFSKPNETFVTGHSMGGVITLATIEKYPEVYDGALPMCGPLNASLTGLQERMFDMLVTFDYLFPNTVGSLANLPKGAKLDQAKVKAALDAAPEKAAMFARRYSLATVAEISNVLAFFYEINRELQERAGGNPFDNRNTIYDGFDDDVALNRGVKRYAADAKAREYLRQHNTPTGRISDPVLTIHTTYDQLVPGRYISEYARNRRDQIDGKPAMPKEHINPATLFPSLQHGSRRSSLRVAARPSTSPARPRGTSRSRSSAERISASRRSKRCGTSEPLSKPPAERWPMWSACASTSSIGSLKTPRRWARRSESSSPRKLRRPARGSASRRWRSKSL